MNLRFSENLAWNTCRMLLLFVAIATAPGCSMLSNMTGVPVAEKPAVTQSFLLELHNSFGRPNVKQMPFNEGLTVQDVLDKSGAKHRDMEIDVIRKLSGSGQDLKMPVVYDSSKKRVKYEQNYAIYANDRVIIRPKNGGPFDKALGTLSGDN